MKSKITQEKKFQPITLELTIENEDELNYLVSLLNEPNNMLEDGEYPFDSENVKSFNLWYELRSLVE